MGHWWRVRGRYPFEGPQESNLDSAPDKSRHKLTRKRCEQIRCIKPNGVLVWAAAFPPSTWTAGFMTNATFDYVIAEIESKDTEVFPENIRTIVHTFGSERSTFLLGSVPIPTDSCSGLPLKADPPRVVSD
jgi:hypothetical protein